MKESRFRTQIPFADAFGVDQTTVSKWMLGKTALTVDQVVMIEQKCGLAPGQIFVWAGLVDLATVQSIDPDGEDQLAAIRARRVELEQQLASVESLEEAELAAHQGRRNLAPGVEEDVADIVEATRRKPAPSPRRQRRR